MPAILRRRAHQAPTADRIGGTAGWRPFGVGAQPNEQIGAFDGSLLNQFPAKWDEPQLWGGVIGLNSHWQVPTVSVLPYWVQTQRPTNLPSAQRDASRYTGGIGPLTARRFRANVTAAQVRQSGAQAMAWASDLNLQTASD